MGAVMTAPMVPAEVLAEALFVSALQESDHPTTEQVRAAVTACTDRFHEVGCAGLVAQEFGEHPDCAITRMRWARRTVRDAYDLKPVFAGAAT